MFASVRRIMAPRDIESGAGARRRPPSLPRTVSMSPGLPGRRATFVRQASKIREVRTISAIAVCRPAFTARYIWVLSEARVKAASRTRCPSRGDRSSLWYVRSGCRKGRARSRDCLPYRSITYILYGCYVHRARLRRRGHGTCPRTTPTGKRARTGLAFGISPTPWPRFTIRWQSGLCRLWTICARSANRPTSSVGLYFDAADARGDRGLAARR